MRCPGISSGSSEYLERLQMWWSADLATAINPSCRCKSHDSSPSILCSDSHCFIPSIPVHTFMKSILLYTLLEHLAKTHQSIIVLIVVCLVVSLCAKFFRWNPTLLSACESDCFLSSVSILSTLSVLTYIMYLHWTFVEQLSSSVHVMPVYNTPHSLIFSNLDASVKYTGYDFSSCWLILY